jgi:toxin YoeB
VEIIFRPQAIEDLTFWKKSGNIQAQNKITLLLKSIVENPYEGIGTPEALKYELTGKWSRRINKEHRIVYDVCDNNINIYQLRFHY